MCALQTHQRTKPFTPDPPLRVAHPLGQNTYLSCAPPRLLLCHEHGTHARHSSALAQASRQGLWQHSGAHARPGVEQRAALCQRNDRHGAVAALPRASTACALCWKRVASQPGPIMQHSHSRHRVRKEHAAQHASLLGACTPHAWREARGGGRAGARAWEMSVVPSRGSTAMSTLGSAAPSPMCSPQYSIGACAAPAQRHWLEDAKPVLLLVCLPPAGILLRHTAWLALLALQHTLRQPTQLPSHLVLFALSNDNNACMPTRHAAPSVPLEHSRAHQPHALAGTLKKAQSSAPSIFTVLSTRRIISTAAWSAAFLSPCVHHVGLYNCKHSLVRYPAVH